MIFDNIKENIVEVLGGNKGDSVSDAIDRFKPNEYFTAENIFNLTNIIIGVGIFFLIFYASFDKYSKNRLIAFFKTFLLAGGVAALAGVYKISLDFSRVFETSAEMSNLSKFYMSTENVILNPFSLVFIGLIIYSNYQKSHLEALCFGATAGLIPLFLPISGLKNGIVLHNYSDDTSVSEFAVFGLVIKVLIFMFMCYLAADCKKFDKALEIFCIFYFISDFISFTIYYYSLKTADYKYTNFLEAYSTEFLGRHIFDLSVLIVAIVFSKIYSESISRNQYYHTSKDEFSIGKQEEENSFGKIKL